MLNKIIRSLLSIVLFNVIVIFMLSYTMKNNFQKDIFSSVIKNAATKSLSEVIQLNEEQTQRLNTLLDKKDAQVIINDFSNGFIDVIASNGTIEFDASIIDDLIDYLIVHEEDVKQIIDTSFDADLLKEIKNSADYEHVKNNVSLTINNNLSKDTNPNVAKALSAYSFLTSNDFLILLLIAMFILIVSLILIEQSLYKWLLIFGKAVVISGVLMYVFLLVLQTVLNKISSDIGINIVLNIKASVILFLLFILIGIICLLIYKSINKIQRNKEKELVIN